MPKPRSFKNPSIVDYLSLSVTKPVHLCLAESPDFCFGGMFLQITHIIEKPIFINCYPIINSN